MEPLGKEKRMLFATELAGFQARRRAGRTCPGLGGVSTLGVSLGLGFRVQGLNPSLGSLSKGT